MSRSITFIFSFLISPFIIVINAQETAQSNIHQQADPVLNFYTENYNPDYNNIPIKSYSNPTENVVGNSVSQFPTGNENLEYPGDEIFYVPPTYLYEHSVTTSDYNSNPGLQSHQQWTNLENQTFEPFELIRHWNSLTISDNKESFDKDSRPTFPKDKLQAIEPKIDTRSDDGHIQEQEFKHPFQDYQDGGVSLAFNKELSAEGLVIAVVFAFAIYL